MSAKYPNSGLLGVAREIWMEPRHRLLSAKTVAERALARGGRGSSADVDRLMQAMLRELGWRPRAPAAVYPNSLTCR